MRANVATGGLWGGLVVVGLGVAQPTPISIWYRSTEACPSGEQFISRLRELGRDAQLAGVGDAIDFVVTLGDIIPVAPAIKASALCAAALRRCIAPCSPTIEPCGAMRISVEA